MKKPAQMPLQGIKVVEFAGIGPVPFCGMLLADMGADVVRIDRPGTPDTGSADIQGRGKRSICLNLKQPEDKKTASMLMAKADLLMEGFRPGVMERLGLGPEMALAQNPALVYGRMTGWGQDGPLAQRAGHDINYIAITGALNAMGSADTPPPPPLNLLGDYGGGALYLVMGLLAGLIHARASGQGQVIDAAIVDGTLSLMAPIHWLRASGMWQNSRNSNLLDGAAHFYSSYICQDGRYLAVGAIEPQFYAELCDGLGIGEDIRNNQYDQAKWPVFKAELAGIFASKPLKYWLDVFANSDACVAPVEDMVCAMDNRHLQARKSLLQVDGVLQPAPAPRFSETPGAIARPPPIPDGNRKDILRDWLD